MSNNTPYYKHRLGFDPNGDLEGRDAPKVTKDEFEETVYRFKDERDSIQKKTFTKWVNKHLAKVNKSVDDLFLDLRNGDNLLSLLEVLSGEQFGREKGHLRFHAIQNVQTVLDFLRYKKIKLVNIRADDIVDGNPKLILGLIWTIILHFQISDLVGEHNAKEALLRWSQRTTEKYPGVRVVDFTKSWKDGLAFNAILHRHRPDLVQWKSLANMSPRERLENAFHIAEKEYGVTRLLDPEDVDTPEPDEKSVITYVSCLYDAFPVAPALHPLAEEDARRRSEEYKNFASRLYGWMVDTLAAIEEEPEDEEGDGESSASLDELKATLMDVSRFRNEHIPPRLKDKHTCSHLWREIEKLIGDPAQAGLIDDDSIHITNIERTWKRLLDALADRERRLQDKVGRSDKLHRLAEKILRDCRRTDARLDDIERELAEEVRRADRLRLDDVKANCERIGKELDECHEGIQALLEGSQQLKDAKYGRARDVQKRVHEVSERWSNITGSFGEFINSPSLTRPLTLDELVQSDERFRSLHECLIWVQQKMQELENADYGTELPGVKQELDSHRTEHRRIEQYRAKIEQCAAVKPSMRGEESVFYAQLLGQVERSYSELLLASNKRTSDLESLLDFVDSATKELVWLNGKEETEVRRDWGADNLDLVAVEQYYENLMSELEKREVGFNAVLSRGEGLLLASHPGVKSIEAHLAAMQALWSWVLQLTLCLEIHLHHASSYHRFFLEGDECLRWIEQQQEAIATTFERDDFSLEEGEQLMKAMQDIREDLTRNGEVVDSLVERSKEVLPLKMRNEPLTSGPVLATAICQYKHVQSNMIVEKQEDCTVLDNSNVSRWRVTNSAGVEGEVPGVCFLIPPPNEDALDLGERLQLAYDRCIDAWQKKQHRMRQNMIFATIKVVTEWTFEQYMAMAPDQREAVIRALNEDAEKLISEGDPADPRLQLLQDEIDQCNRLFGEYEQRAERGEVAKVTFADDIQAFQSALDDSERSLKERCLSQIPRSLETLETLVVEHKEFESHLQNMEELVERVQETFRELPKKSAGQQTRLEKCIDKWERVWASSSLYVERLKCVEVALTDLEEVTKVVSELELKLAASDAMPSELEALQRVYEDVQSIQTTLQTQQDIVKSMMEHMTPVRPAVINTRPDRTRHPDVDRLEEDAKKLVKRWNQLGAVVPERLRNCEAAADVLQQYQEKMEVHKGWVSQMEQQVKEMNDLEASLEFHDGIMERRKSIEAMNAVGARFLAEAKLYESGQRKLVLSLEEVHPTLRAPLVPAYGPSPSHGVVIEMDGLASRYVELVGSVRTRIRSLIDDLRHSDPSMAARYSDLLADLNRPFRVRTLHDLVKSGGDVADGGALHHSAHETLSRTTSARNTEASVLYREVSSSSSTQRVMTNGVLGSSVQFTEIRSAKRIERIEEAISTDVSGLETAADDVRSKKLLAMEERCKITWDALEKLLQWMDEMEGKLASQDAMKEDDSKLKNQIDNLKKITQELESRGRNVHSVLDQVDALTDEGKDVLNPEDIGNVLAYSEELKNRYSSAHAQADHSLRKLEAGLDDLSKYRSELRIFSSWLTEARKTCDDKERMLATDVNKSKALAETVKEFLGDVMAHQADLRFITMSGQKFLDASKDHVKAINAYRTNLPPKLRGSTAQVTIETSESKIRREVTDLSAAFQDVLSRAKRLADTFSSVTDRQRLYSEAVDSARSWLRDVEPGVKAACSEPLGPDSRSLQGQLDRVKDLRTEVLSQARLMDGVGKATKSLIDSFGGAAGSQETSRLEATEKDILGRYQGLVDSVNGRLKALETALVQCQDVQDAIDSQVAWLDKLEANVRAVSKPVSLNRERLNDQLEEHAIVESDLETHRRSIESLSQRASQLIQTSPNPGLSRKLDSKLREMNSRFQTTVEKIETRSTLLREVSRGLDLYQTGATGLDQWLSNTEGSLLTDTGPTAGQLTDISRNRDVKARDFEDTLQKGRSLAARKDVTDVGPIRDQMKSLEARWRQLDEDLKVMSKLDQSRAHHRAAYEKLKDQVLQWLSRMQTKVETLPALDLEPESIKRQMDVLKPLVKEHADYAPTIERVNGLGITYEAALRGEMGDSSASLRRSSSSVSPAKRVSLVSLGSSPGRKGSFGSTEALAKANDSAASAIRDQLGHINDQYQRLGINLGERRASLESLGEELKSQSDSLKAAVVELDRIERQISGGRRPSLPKTREEADEQLKNLRKAQEMLYDVQPRLDASKNKIDSLAQGHDGGGAQKLKDSAQQAVERWSRLQSHCKDRCQLLDGVREFLDSCDGFGGWLAAKDRMMSILGPIAADPRVVDTQLRQIQVLRDEFNAQFPQLENLNKLGANLITKLSTDEVDGQPASGDGKKLTERLNGLNQKWDGLLGLLDERHGALGAAAGASKDFNALVNQIQSTLQQVGDELEEMLGPTGADGANLEKQLEKLQKLGDDLDAQRPLLAEAASLGEHLSNVLVDSASRNDVRNALGQAERTHAQLQRKLDNRRAELELGMKDLRDFGENCVAISDWLKEALELLSDKLLVSADEANLRKQVETFDPLYKEIMSREHEVIMLTNKGEHLIASKQGSLSSRDLTKTLRKDLDNLQKLWGKLKQEATTRHSRLQTCTEHCRRFATGQGVFLPWLAQAEEKLQKVRLEKLGKPQLDKALKEATGLKNEVARHSQEYENNRNNGETLLAATDKDKDGVNQELASMRNRWNSINAGVQDKMHLFEELSTALQSFSEKAKDLGDGLLRVQDRISSQDPLFTSGGGDAMGEIFKDPKMLERTRALLDETRNMESSSREVDRRAEDLLNQLAMLPEIDGGEVEQEADDLRQTLKALCDGLEGRCRELERASLAANRVKDGLRSTGADLSNLQEELEAMKPVARDPDSLTCQAEEIAKFQHKVDDGAHRLEEMAQQCSELIKEGGNDAKVAKEQLEALKKQLARIQDKARAREEEVSSARTRLGSFSDLKKNLIQDVKAASCRLDDFRPVGMSDVDALRSQQKDLAQFAKDKVEPLAQQVDQCSRQGQGLIQSAAPGVDTHSLEQDIDNLNGELNLLKEKLSQRQRSLDLGLLNSGKFQEALSGLGNWLADAEELIGSQKPPAADYKVVRAQLQEQKAINKMLSDRQPSLDSLSMQGQEVTANAEALERKQIEDQVRDLVLRFDSLQNAANARTSTLENTLEVAKEFHDKFFPLMEFMAKAEKKIHEMETVPTDEDKIQMLIEQHEMLHDDILAVKPSFQDATDVAQALMSLVGDEDAELVADRVQGATDQYTALVEDSESIAQLLEDSKGNLRKLVLSYEDLLTWLDTAESRLNTFKVMSVFTETLVEQTAELTALTEEIDENQKRVDDVVDCGLELMKHISSEEALLLKDKLISIQRKHQDLTTKGSELLRHATDALPLVEQFHMAHERLSHWLVAAENRISSLDQHNIMDSSFALVEKEISLLETEIQEVRPLVEAVNLIGPQLCQLSPGEGAATIESFVTRDNRRYEAVCEQVQRRAERVQLAKQRSLEVVSDVDDLLEWFREMEGQLQDADPPSCDPEVIRMQLKEHRALTDDLSSQKSRVRDALASAKKLLREASKQEDTSILREKMDDLKDAMDNASRLAMDRLSALEQALPLAEHLYDTHGDLCDWLDDVEEATGYLDAPALRPEQILRQQENNAGLLESIAEHKPIVDKLLKTGATLERLCGEEDAAKVRDVVESDSQRYNALRSLARTRQQALEEAMQETAQFADKLDGLLSALASAADQVNNAEPISAHPDKIHEQLAENAGILEDLYNREGAYTSVSQAAEDVVAKTGGDTSDPAVRDIMAKLGRLNSLWDHVRATGNNRNRSLEEALSLAEKFWDEHQNVSDALRGLQRQLSSQDAPGVEPDALDNQKKTLDDITRRLEGCQPNLDACRTAGRKLVSICGDSDKPEIRKCLDDLEVAWDGVTQARRNREETLKDAMEAASEYQQALKDFVEFLARKEGELDAIGAPVDSDLEVVKKQMEALKKFKAGVDPETVNVEALNRLAQDLAGRTTPDQASKMRKPLQDANKRWDSLQKAIADRQRELEQALLRLGQFHHALKEMMVWIKKTDETVDSLQPVLGDPAMLQVELAKLKVLTNDIHAHQSSIDSLNDAGRHLIESNKKRGSSEEATATQTSLNELKEAWEQLLDKTEHRRVQLEDALKEAEFFNGEIQDLLVGLSDVDNALSGSKPTGGLPETAQEQLSRFMESVYDEVEGMRPKVDSVLQRGQGMVDSQKQASPSASLPATSSGHALQQNLRTLKQKWGSTVNRANDKKVKLEIALKEATEFRDALQQFVNWLTDAEKLLGSLHPVSKVMDSILKQIEDHKEFQKDVSAHREIMLDLDKKGTHLKYFSQKQDVILIKNLLISVQHRWERVVAKSAERTRALDHGYKEAKEFHDKWSSLCQWLDEAQKKLSEADPAGLLLGNDPDKIKALLTKHKDFQRQLGAKQPGYDTTMKSGKVLKDKAPKNDQPMLQEMLEELKTKWNAVCQANVERQRKLEEALLFCGQFKEATGALLDWLKKAETELSQESPVFGDLDTVMALVEQHASFQAELERRSSQVTSVKSTAEEMLKKSKAEGQEEAEAAVIQSQIEELLDTWERVIKLSEAHGDRLDDAVKRAEELHKAVHMLLEWLSDAEMKLRFAGPMPDTEEATEQQLEEHRKFLHDLAEKRTDKESTLALAQEILDKCHPDSAPVIKHWTNIIQTRWEEVSSWAEQREQRLVDHLKQLKELAGLLEELLKYLDEKEKVLVEAESEPLPDELEAMETLAKEHQELMEDMAKKQPDVDRICKPKRASTVAPPSHHPGSLRKSSKSSRQPSREPETPSREGSPSRDAFGPRKFSRFTPDREGTPERFPHIGPRFTSEPMSAPARKGSRGAPRNDTGNSRSRELWEKWRRVWTMAWDRQRRLYDKLDYLREVERLKTFSFEEWRKRFMAWLNHKKSRAMDLFRKMDKDNDGRVLKDPDFIDGIIKSKFKTTWLEMKVVADIMDRNNDGYIDYQEFMAALRPDWNFPVSEQEQIEGEVERQVEKCTCVHKFQVQHVGEGQYRFGESQKLRLVRILRSTVMVRVGGGWVPLDEFLVKNDPCRARGRTNVELHEHFMHPADGSTPIMNDRRGASTSSLLTSSTPTSGQRASLPVAGPITKIREKTARSTPMSRTSFSASSAPHQRPDSRQSDGGASGKSNGSGGAAPTSFSLPRTSSAGIKPRVGFSLHSTPVTTGGSSRPSSRLGAAGSRGASRNGGSSQPPSRAGSDMSLDSAGDGGVFKKPASVKRTPSLTTRAMIGGKSTPVRSGGVPSRAGSMGNLATPRSGSKVGSTGSTSSSSTVANWSASLRSPVSPMVPNRKLASSTSSLPSLVAGAGKISSNNPGNKTKARSKIPVAAGGVTTPDRRLRKAVSVSNLSSAGLTRSSNPRPITRASPGGSGTPTGSTTRLTRKGSGASDVQRKTSAKPSTIDSRPRWQ